VITTIFTKNRNFRDNSQACGILKIKFFQQIKVSRLKQFESIKDHLWIPLTQLNGFKVLAKENQVDKVVLVQSVIKTP
jgi:hypothetical protein